MRHKAFVTLMEFFVTLKYLPDFGVGEARVRIHHCFIKLILLELPLWTDGHFAHHTQAVYFRIE